MIEPPDRWARSDASGSQISWLEPETEQGVSQVINLNTWTIITSFHFNEGKGLALWQGDIISFGDIPDPPMIVPEQ